MLYGVPTSIVEEVADAPEPLGALPLPLLLLVLHAASTALAARSSTAPALFAFLVDIIIDLPIPWASRDFGNSDRIS
jgi:hypothetical protein